MSYYQFENLAACRRIKHRIFCRKGGHSRPPFGSLNVSLGVGDEKDRVVRNRDLIAGSLEARDLVFVRQVHGREIEVLAQKYPPPGNCPDRTPAAADAMVTNQPQKYLAIQVADCQAVLMYEPVRQVVANVHCGWRGSIQNIIGRTVAAMKQTFDCSPAHIQAGIGPSLGPCCAEFINYRAEIPQTLWHYKDSRNHFDFWSISGDQLMDAGVLPRNIEPSRICTRCHTHEFFSYRAEKNTGRFAVVIGLK